MVQDTHENFVMVLFRMRLCMPRKGGVQITFCIRGYHAAVGELLTCKREVKNTIVMYCATIKTEDLSETEWKVATFSMSHLLVSTLRRGHLT